ncbi:MAG: hypothetical protein KAT29_05710, partial [Anaerolineales bacterium]|nr:hypothetical protein [Anaerolineales bacterium]
HIGFDRLSARDRLADQRSKLDCPCRQHLRDISMVATHHAAAMIHPHLRIDIIAHDRRCLIGQ